MSTLTYSKFNKRLSLIGGLFETWMKEPQKGSCYLTGTFPPKEKINTRSVFHVVIQTAFHR